MPFADDAKRRDYHREWMRRHKAQTAPRQREWRSARRLELYDMIRAATSAGCSVPGCDCREPRVIDLHHVDPAEKLFTLSDGVRLLRIGYEGAMVLEVSRCIAICANCHRLLHSLRRDGIEPPFDPAILPRAHLPVLEHLRTMGERGAEILQQFRQCCAHPPGREAICAGKRYRRAKMATREDMATGGAARPADPPTTASSDDARGGARCDHTQHAPCRETHGQVDARSRHDSTTPTR